MSDEILKGIKTKVESIDNNTKHFGAKVRMPDGDVNEDKEISKQALLYNQMIMGSLAYLIWGERSKLQDDQVKSLITGSKPTIFSLLQGISDVITSNNFIGSQAVKDLSNNVKTLSTSINNLSSHIVDNANFIAAAQQFMINAQKFMSNVNNGNFTSISQDRLNELIKALENQNNSNTQSTSTGNTGNTTNPELSNKPSKDAVITGKGLSELYSFIRSMNDNFDIDATKVENNIRALNNLITGGNTKASLISLIGSINEIAGSEDINVDNLEAINIFFDAVSKIGDIGLIKRLKIKSNLVFFKKYIVVEIPEILTALKDTENKYADRETLRAIAALGSVFEMFLKIAEIDDKKRKQVKSNLKYFNKYIAELINDDNGLIKTIINSVKDVEPEIEKTVKALNDFLDKIISIGDISFMKLIKLEIKLDYLSSIFTDYLIGENDSSDALIRNIIKLSKQTLNAANERIKLINSILTDIKTIDSLLLPIKDLVKETIKINLLTSNFWLFITFFNKLSKQKINIDQIQKYLDNIKLVVQEAKNVVDKLNEINIDDNLVNSVEQIIRLLRSLDVLSLLSMGSKISEIGMAGIEKTADSMITIIKKFEKVKKEDVEKAIDTANAFTKLIAISGAILIAGALVMRKVNILNLIMFTVSLSFFLFAVAGVYVIIGNNLKKTIDIAKSTVDLIWISAAVLIAGSLISRYIKFSDILMFTAMLSFFLFAVARVYVIIGNNLEETIDIAKSTVDLIWISAAVLIAGSLTMALINPLYPFLFGVILAGFIFLVVKAFNKISKDFDNAYETAKGITLLIAVSGIILMIGSLFMQNPKLAIGAIAFVVLLSTFIFAIMYIFNHNSKDLRVAFKTAQAIAILIAVSALVLMIGSLFMQDIRRAIGAIEFAILLAIFVRSILKIFSSNEKKAKLAIPTAIAISIVTFISAITLLIGGGLLVAFPDLIWAVPYFGTLVLAYMGVMVAIIAAAAEVGKSIWFGIAAIAAVAACTVVIAFAMGKIVEISQMLNGPQDWRNLIIVTGIAFGIMYVLVGLAIAVGALESTGIGAAVIWTAVGVVAALVACIWVLADAIRIIVDSMKLMAEVSTMEFDIGNMLKILFSFYALVTPMINLAAIVPIMLLGAASMLCISSVLSKAADIIQLYASLKIPIYEGDKIVGYKIMSENDFTLAAANMRLVVMTIFDTMKDIYEKNRSMFSFSITSLLSGNGGTMFGEIASAGKALAVMLSMLASSIQDWADLKIPIYDNKGKIAGYKTIDNAAFVRASENIQKVVTCLAQAVMDVYNNDTTGIFGYNVNLGILSGLSGTIFEKVAGALTSLGSMLSEIGSAIKYWADLKIPIYDNKGQITGYKTIDDSAFVKAAENIKKVVMCLADAVMDVYNNDKNGIFNYNYNFIGPYSILSALSGTVFGRITGALKTMGDMLSEIASAVKDWADLKIPVYVQGSTKVQKYISLTDNDLKNVAKNIGKVVVCLFDAVSDVYRKNEKLFDTGFLGLSDSPITKVLDAIGPLGKGLSKIADAVKDWADLKIPVYAQNSTKVQSYVSLTNKDFTNVGENINTVVTCLFKAVEQVYKDNGDLFNGGWDDFFGKDDPIFKVLNAINPLGKALSNIAEAVENWADLKVPVYGEKGIQPISYKALTSDEFGPNGKVSTNIATVVTSLFKAVAGLYNDPELKKIGNIFDNTGFWGTGDSIIDKVLGAVIPLGEALSNIAEAIDDWADLKIPIYDQTSKDPTKPVGYKALGDGDFSQAAAHINTVVTALFTTLGTIYDTNKNKGWFDSDSWFSNDNKLGKVLGSIAPMGEALKNIADSIVMFGDFKIPTYAINEKTGQLEITGYKTIMDNDINSAGEGIGKIVCGLVEAVASLYDKPELKKKGIFDEPKTWMDRRTPFAKVITSIEPLGNIIAGIAEGVKGFAGMNFPIYGKNKNGELEIVGYKHLSQTDLTMLAINIGTVITSLGNAISKVAETHEELFSKEDNPAVKAALAISQTGNTLESIANVVANYATGKFPILEYDKDGNLVPGKMIDINKNLEKDLETNVGRILTALGNAVISVYNLDKNKQIWSQFEFTDNKNGIKFKKESPIMIVTSGIKAITESLTATLDLIGKMVELDFNKLYNSLDSKNGLVTSFANVMNSICKIVKVFFGKFEGGGLLGHTYTIYGYLSNENISKVTASAAAIENISDALAKIFGASTELYKEYKEHAKDLGGIDKVDVEKIKGFIDNITPLTNKINGLIIELIKNLKIEPYEAGGSGQLITPEAIGTIQTNNSTYLDTVKGCIEDINTWTANVVGILGKNNGSNEIKLEDVNVITQAIKSINTTINGITITNQSDLENFNGFLSNFALHLKTISIIFKTIDEFNVLKDGMTFFYTTIEKIESSNLLNKNAASLKKYLEIINSVNIRKLGMLKDFIDAVNKLSSDFKGIDKLTDAIANRLSLVLYELVEQLTKAEMSIENAHQLQEERKKLIEESVNNIKDIMNQHMIVEISQLSEEDQNGGAGLITPGGNINGEQTDETTSTGTDTSTSGQQHQDKPSPEDASQKNKKYNNNSNALTYSQFIAEMSDHRNKLDDICKKLKNIPGYAG